MGSLQEVADKQAGCTSWRMGWPIAWQEEANRLQAHPKMDRAEWISEVCLVPDQRIALAAALAMCPPARDCDKVHLLNKPPVERQAKEEAKRSVLWHMGFFGNATFARGRPGAPRRQARG